MKQSNFVDLLDSDSDDGLIARTSAIKKAENMPAAKKPRGRAVANRVAKTEDKATTRRAGAKKAAAAEEELERQALADKPTNEKPKATRGRKTKKAAAEEPDEEEEEEGDADVLATPPGSDEPVRAKGGRGRPRKESVVPESVQKTGKPGPAKRGGRKAAVAQEPAPEQEDVPEVPETQADDLMDMDREDQDQVEDLPTFSRFSAPPSVHRSSSYHIPHSATKRSASSSLESDHSVRRRLGEMTSRYEALELKYKELRNVVVTEAEKTFDRLKKTSDESNQSTRIKTTGVATRNSIANILQLPISSLRV